MQPDNGSRAGARSTDAAVDQIVGKTPQPSVSEAQQSDMRHTSAAEEDLDSGPGPLAFVVVVTSPNGRYRRRAYLTLRAAHLAYERAHARGDVVRLQLCTLYPLGGAV